MYLHKYTINAIIILVDFLITALYLKKISGQAVWRLKKSRRRQFMINMKFVFMQKRKDMMKTYQSLIQRQLFLGACPRTIIFKLRPLYTVSDSRPSHYIWYIKNLDSYSRTCSQAIVLLSVCSAFAYLLCYFRFLILRYV